VKSRGQQVAPQCRGLTPLGQVGFEEVGLTAVEHGSCLRGFVSQQPFMESFGTMKPPEGHGQFGHEIFLISVLREHPNAQIAADSFDDRLVLFRHRVIGLQLACGRLGRNIVEHEFSVIGGVDRHRKSLVRITKLRKARRMLS
jgi:hypothetical protein